MKRILFVDDERHILSGLRRQLHGLRREWTMAFAAGGPEAIEALDADAFDVVVTDMKMPGADGAQVLAHAVTTRPSCARIVLSGYADPERHRLASTCAHRYLDKPCPPELLELEVRQALAVQDALEELGDERLVRLWREPPALEATFAELVTALCATTAVLPPHVDQLLHTHEEVWAAVAEVLARVPEAGGVVPASAADAVRSLGARVVLHALLVVSFLRRFEQGSGRLAEESLALGGACLEVAAEQGLDETSRLDVFVAGLLYPRLARGVARPWLDALAYLLPTSGFGEPCVEALTLGDRPEGGLGGPSGAVRAAVARARVRVGDPAAQALSAWLDT